MDRQIETVSFMLDNDFYKMFGIEWNRVVFQGGEGNLNRRIEYGWRIVSNLGWDGGLYLGLGKDEGLYLGLDQDGRLYLGLGEDGGLYLGLGQDGGLYLGLGQDG